MHKYNIGQVHCVERVKRIHAKFMFFFRMIIQICMNFGTLYEFLELNKQKWELENNLPATGPNSAEAQHGRPSLAAKTAYDRLILGWACSPCRNWGGRLSWRRGGGDNGQM
jgi:hypothetical protein